MSIALSCLHTSVHGALGLFQREKKFFLLLLVLLTAPGMQLATALLQLSSNGYLLKLHLASC